MELFPRNYDLINEITEFEELMPTYKDALKHVGNVIRNKIVVCSDPIKFALLLHLLNNLLSIALEIIPEDLEVAIFYVGILDKYRESYSNATFIHAYYEEVTIYLSDEYTKELFRDQWERINPYFRDDFTDDTYKKDIIELLDEVLGCVENDKTSIIVNEKDYKELLRGRKGIFYDEIDVYPPSVEIAEKYNIINRWNPPSKRYLYVVPMEAERKQAEIVCLNELRATKGTEVTTALFSIRKEAYDKKILNLDYSAISMDDIAERTSNELNSIVKECIVGIKRSSNVGVNNLSGRIKEAVAQRKNRVSIIAEEHCAKSFFKYFCETVFVPLDDDEDNDSALKDKCYKSFHVLAEYLEAKGFGGIAYPSTRMLKIGRHGTNVVLFNVDDALVEKGTIGHIQA